MHISELKNHHAGQRCFILGSGPSIARQDLSVLREEITFCCNWFFNHADFDELNINYYCAYDDDFFCHSLNHKWFDRLLTLDTMKFFPQHWRIHNLALSNICYVPYNKEKKVYQLNQFSVDTDQGFYDGATVIINFCLPLAIHMGFSEIILLGCDSDYGINTHGDMRDAYFYDQKDHHAATVHTANSELKWQDHIFISYAVVEEYARQHDVRIVNATPGGNLESFERVELKNIVNEGA